MNTAFHMRRSGRKYILPLVIVALSVGLGLLFGCDEDSDNQCDQNPCQLIQNAVAGSCYSLSYVDYSCNCVENYFWNQLGHSCTSPCTSEPCSDVPNAIGCTASGFNTWSCKCIEGLIWLNDACVDDPCEPNECVGMTGSPGGCDVIDVGVFECDCYEDQNYFWNSGSETCDNPCDPDPCLAKSNTDGGDDDCTGTAADTYRCDCADNYFWNRASETCDNPCDPDPCLAKADTDGGGDDCTGTAADTYSCDCADNYFWNSSSETCDNPCDPDPCLAKANIDGGGDDCTGTAADTYSCDCADNYFWNSSSETCDNPCDANPCEGPENTSEPCAPLDLNDYTCACDSEYIWNDDDDKCWHNPCEPQDPCDDTDFAIDGSCVMDEEEENDYSCTCDRNFSWEDTDNGGICSSCDRYETCLLFCPFNANFDVCVSACITDYAEGCVCDLDLTSSPSFDLTSSTFTDCYNECIFSVTQWNCTISCYFDRCR